VVDLRIVDTDGNDAPVGDVGEIWVKGPLVVRGYLGREREIAEAITDGWFHTGDLGRFDADGNVYVVDRLKDMIIRGGENIYAAEIEAALYEHPDITEAAIIGVPSEKYGEEVMAWIRPRDGVSLSEEILVGACRGRIATVKIPRFWKVVDSFPMTVTGKIQKYRMREIAIEEIELGAPKRR
jgi:fatty-acyl-CoA synthase